MKKITTIALCSVAFIAMMSSFPHTYSLVEKGVENTSFGFTGEAPKTRYYLVGNFTSTPWAMDNSYLLQDGTSTMDQETNKEAEYNIKNVSLTKGQILKARSDNGDWYSSFAHMWSNSINKDGDGNYIVPMTSKSYRFYLKFYTDKTTQLYIKADKDVMFFKPSSDWAKDSAKFKVEFDNEGPELLSNKEDNYYKFTVPSGAKQIKFLRYSSDGNTCWNYSSFISLANTDTNNAFVLNGGKWNDWGAGDGTWSAR